MLAGWVLYAATYAGFAMATGRASFLGCLAAYTLFNGLSTSVQRAVVADLVPKELRGTAFGLFYFAIGLASLPSSWLFGKVADLKGAPAAFGMDAAVAVVACLMLLAVRKPAGAAPPAS